MGDDADLERRVSAVLDREIRPLVQSHGGDVGIESVRDGHVAVAFRAACDGCGLRAVTFGATVRPRLLRVAGVRSVTCDAVLLSPARLDAIAAFGA